MRIIQILLINIFLINFLSCSIINENNSENKENIDSSLNISNIRNIKYDTILILSSDGKLLRNFIYENEPDTKIGTYPKYANYIKGYPKDNDTIFGDFNGDGVSEKAWFADIDYKTYCDCETIQDEKSCRRFIHFSDPKIPKLKIDYCPMWTWKNEGDLNSDGADEIGVLPGWFVSGCRTYEVYSLNKNKWELKFAIGNAYNMREAGIVFIEKDKKKEGYVIIRHEIFFDAYELFSLPLVSKNIMVGSCSFSHVIEKSVLF